MDSIILHQVIAFLLLFVVKSSQAFDGGDALALILGLVIGIIGILACIGCYTRRRGG